MMKSLRSWWQNQTGEEETPFDGDSPSFVVSLVVHLVVMLVLGLCPVASPPKQNFVAISAPPPAEKFEEMKVPDEFYFSNQPSDEIGANSASGSEVAFSEAPIISEVSALPNHADIPEDEIAATVELNRAIDVATGLHFNEKLTVKGAAGEGTTGAVGAIDRLTNEIILSLEERKTLVVWLFDSTASLIPQRNSIHDRFDRIYEELGIIQASGNKSFAKHEDKPLLSTVIAFGRGMQPMTKKPTDDLEELKAAVKAIPNDDSGDENVFSAIHEAAKTYASYRYTSEGNSEPQRNVMIVVVTDEAGSDQKQLDQTVAMCRRWTMPVYVVGVPAPFGRRETMMKYIDPDPKFSQAPQWGVVEQGPESFQPERIRLSFSGSKADDDAIDSGFGPYSLTRLCVETGGIYFTVHPNRDTQRAVSRQDTAAFSAHINRFFDPEVMRRYRPDYVSTMEYQKRVSQNKARMALVSASARTQLDQMEDPRTRFVKRDEAEFNTDLSEAQQNAARLEPQINALYEVLKVGEADREKETVPRWQAGFDLAMGRLLAVKVRTESYNQMLAGAKRGLKFKNEKNNTWILKPSDSVSVGSQMVKVADKAKMYLTRVVKDHPGTPWALLAERELKDPLSWEWQEDFTPAPKPMMGDGGNGNPAPGRDEKKMMLKKPDPVRPPPKL